MALLYKKYTDNKILYELEAQDELEAQAKNRRIGLWVDENPVAPWDWRRGKLQPISKIRLRVSLI